MNRADTPVSPEEDKEAEKEKVHSIILKIWNNGIRWENFQGVQYLQLQLYAYSLYEGVGDKREV